MTFLEDALQKVSNDTLGILDPLAVHADNWPDFRKKAKATGKLDDLSENERLVLLSALWRHRDD